MEDILQEIENEARLNKPFHSVINQPALVSISSVDTTLTPSAAGFSKFVVSLPRPVLEANSIQLLHANIPACTQNIPDTACVFWYYRLSEYSGRTPTPDNLFYVRLLPSFYKPEFISATCGQNRTFNTYQELASQLALSCSTDLGFVNQMNQDIDEDSVDYRVPYLPGEITLPYNAGLNRFQMIGTNATTQLVFVNWSAGATFGLNALVKFGTKAYKSLVAGNIGNTPSTSPASWRRVYLDAVANYESATPYRKGAYVSSGNVLFIALLDNIGVPTSNTATWSTSLVASINYRYLIAGYTDPNVAFLQGNAVRTWNPYSLYEFGDTIAYNGQNWTALEQNTGFVPFATGGSAWSNIQSYSVGDKVSYLGNFYIATGNGSGNTPSTFSTFWSRSYWSLQNLKPSTVGLSNITTEFDMMDQWNGITQYPFPLGIGGQPYVVSPGRLLNSILGFAWNGRMSVQTLSTISQIANNVSTSTTITELYNRLRPVPQYQVRYLTPNTILGSPTANVSQTYTADGYCNLVYSSIVSIYTNIIASSTLNTATSTNLLSTGTMNCANLGISFFAPYLDNQLVVSGTDFDTITIELRDEFNEPYVLTNNAVVSVVLKIEYKQK
jgi:hypothetical protein